MFCKRPKTSQKSSIESLPHWHWQVPTKPRNRRSVDFGVGASTYVSDFANKSGATCQLEFSTLVSWCKTTEPAKSTVPLQRYRCGL